MLDTPRYATETAFFDIAEQSSPDSTKKPAFGVNFVNFAIGGGEGGKDAGHQKYPSAFFFSMLADWSWSIARPWRSDVVVSNIS